MVRTEIEADLAGELAGVLILCTQKQISVPVRVLRNADSDSGMKVDESQLVLLRIEDKAKYEDAISYLYAGTDPAAVHKPITIYKEKNANAYLVAGRYAATSDTHLKYKPLNEEEQKIVVEKLGSGKIIKFLSNETTPLP